MKKSNYKKILIFVIFILFIGTAIAPNISGYVKKTSVQSTKESSASFPLNDDFINAYWKFDECTGSTIGDSSGHDYDGTKYGGTWTTGGHSGCALIFDGVDDYVDLTTYANKIMINKTDDFIISFYFKTSTEHTGIIFSSTGYKNIPEFRLGMLSNGSVELKIWTALCGLKLESKGNYNDGAEHFVEIFYNGITTDPTVEIFIDKSLAAKKTDWLCDIGSSDFLAVTFGKRASDETGFFEGLIDEFKFIKYEGGNKQEPPEINGPTYGDPDVEYDYTFVTNDPEGDQVWIKIDWGDGEITDWLGPYDSGEPVIIPHSYDDEDEYCIKSRSKDRWHQSRWSDCFYVKIGNQAPYPPEIGGPKYGDPDVEYIYTFKSKDFENNKVKYKIQWGDGTTTQTDYYLSNTTIELPHSWGAENDYYITAKAIDIHGKPGLDSVYHIRIGDEPPRKPDIDGPISGKPNVEIDFMFTANDPENDQVWFDIKWGDGEKNNDEGPYDTGETATISHIWTKSGNFIIEACAYDNFGYYGNWESFHIKIPRVKAFNNKLFELLSERFPNAFPIFRYLLGL